MSCYFFLLVTLACSSECETADAAWSSPSRWSLSSGCWEVAACPKICLETFPDLIIWLERNLVNNTGYFFLLVTLACSSEGWTADAVWASPSCWSLSSRCWEVAACPKICLETFPDLIILLVSDLKQTFEYFMGKSTWPRSFIMVWNLCIYSSSILLVNNPGNNYLTYIEKQKKVCCCF